MAARIWFDDGKKDGGETKEDQVSAQGRCNRGRSTALCRGTPKGFGHSAPGWNNPGFMPAPNGHQPQGG